MSEVQAPLSPEEVLNRHHDLEFVLQLIRLERYRQEVKHSDESTASVTNTDAKRLAILVEEVGEVAHAMTYDAADEDELMKELVQVAAVAIAWVESRRRTARVQ